MKISEQTKQREGFKMTTRPDVDFQLTLVNAIRVIEYMGVMQDTEYDDLVAHVDQVLNVYYGEKQDV